MRTPAIAFIFLCSHWLQGQTPDSIWNRSLRCYEQGDYHGTIVYTDSLLQIIPDFSNAFDLRGIARINLGDIEGACADLDLAESTGTGENRRFREFMCDPDFIRNMLLEQFYEKEKVYPELGYRPRYTRADTLRGALRPERTCFDVNFYDLRIKIIPRGKKIEGSNSVYFKVISPTRRIQIDLFENFQVKSIVWNGTLLAWHREYNALFIDFPRELPVGQYHQIQITYGGKPPIAPNPPWDGGFVWERDENKKMWIGVACEHLGASSWWPNKDHFSDKPDSVKIALEVPEGYKAISNGDLVKEEPAGRKYTRYTWFVDYPINNYNVTFYAGRYTAFSDTLTDDGDTLRLDYNVLTYNLDVAREHFKQTQDVLSFYNKAFGYYPFARDGFGLVESPYEGMEHQSAIAYGNGYNKNKQQEYRNQFYDYIIVHEAAHEWWGNSVTASDMADIWIHEGFATYAEYMFLENQYGKDEYMYELTDKSQYIFNVWPMVQNRDVNENTFASNDVYNKGAMMLHCLRCSINNDSLFFSIIHDFCVTNQYKTVTSKDFVDFVNRYTQTDYSAFFNIYLYHTNLPVLEYSFIHDSPDMVFKYRWTGVEEGFSMPFGIGTNNGNSLRMVAGNTWDEVRLPETSWFNFYNIWKGYEGCADNAFTYFRTRWVQNP